MKLLLLLLILSPGILFGQTRRKAIADSIKADATNLQRVSSLVGNNPGSMVEGIEVSDSGENITMVVHIHITEPMALLSFAPIAVMNTGDIITDGVETVTIPPLPPVLEPDMIAMLPTSMIPVDDIPFVNADVIVAPPIPDINVEPTVIQVLSVTQFKIIDIAFADADMVATPPIPDINVEPSVIQVLTVTRFQVKDIAFVDAGMVATPPIPQISVEPVVLLVPGITQFKVKDIAVGSVGLLAAPSIPDINTEPSVVPVLAVAQVRTADIVFGKVNMVAAPPIPNIGLEIIEELSLFPIVVIAIENEPIGRMDTVSVPSFEQQKMPVAGMHLSDGGYALLEKLEGFSPTFYSLKDGGFTIGFGFFFTYGELGKWSKGVTWEQAEVMIRQKVPAYEDQVKQYINVPLTQNEFDALTMLAYNLGGFSKATSIVNDVNRLADFDKLQSDWKRFIHSKAPGVTKGLMKRRSDEIGVRNESNYQPERKIQILKNN